MTATRPRVLHVLEASNHGTGTARHLIDLVRHGGDVDHVVVLPEQSTSRGEPTSDRTSVLLASHGATVVTLPMHRQVARPDTAVAAARLRAVVRRVRPDVVHGHSGVGGALARLSGVGRPVVYTPNGLHPSAAAQRIERWLGRRTAAAIAVSQGEVDLFVERLGMPRDRVHLVPNGIAATSDETPEPLPDLPVPADAPVVGWIGRHAPQKAPEVLVRAAASVVREHETAHVVMAGGGPALDPSRALVSRLGVGDRVHVLGFVAGARRLLPRFDVLALPSRWEGAPYVPLEAMAARIPLVLSTCVGNADLVATADVGWAVPVDDHEALAAALLDALRRPDEARRRAEVAHRRFCRDFTADHMAARTTAVYDAVLSHR